MEKWLLRLWKNQNNENNKNYEQEIDKINIKNEEDNSEQLEPFTFNGDGISITTILDKVNELSGKTEVISENLELLGEFIHSKPVGKMFIKNPKQASDTMELLFNESNELHGECIVHGQILKFQKGKLIDIHYNNKH
jgi:hypothetical protein